MHPGHDVSTILGDHSSILLFTSDDVQQGQPSERSQLPAESCEIKKRQSAMAVTVASPTARYAEAEVSDRELTCCSWDTIENVFYRKDDVYSMLWKISDLSDYLIAGARCGGPIGKWTLRGGADRLSFDQG